MLTDDRRLTESPGPMLKHPQTGANYYDGEQIISHLNYALGPDMWDWEPLEHGFDQDADEVWVAGKLTARFLRHADADEGYRTTITTKIERGWQPVNRRKSDKAPVSLGNDYKAADTDALKRAARLLGVGLDAWAKEGTAPQRAAEPKPMKTKAELADDVRRGVQAARSLGLDMADIDTGPMDRVKLQEVIGELADMVREAQAHRPAVAS